MGRRVSVLGVLRGCLTVVGDASGRPATRYLPRYPRHGAGEHQDVDGDVQLPREEGAGDGGEQREDVQPVALGEDDLAAEEQRQVEDDADDGGGDAGKGGLAPPVARPTLDLRGAEQHEEEAGCDICTSWR